jgi:predicted Zn-dependent protease
MLYGCLLLFALTMQTAPPAPASAPSTEAIGQAYYLFLQGRVFEDRDDLASAIASFRQALELLPRSAPIHVELATVFAQQGQIPDAKTEAQAALAIDPANREAHRILGWIDISTLDRTPAASAGPLLTDAIGHLEQSVAGGSADPTVQLTLAQLYLRRNEADKAVATLQQVLTAEPGYPAALRLLAQAYDSAGRSGDAARALAELSAASPDAVEQRVRQITQLEQNRQWESAASAWADLLGRDPGAVVYRTRYALALANAGQLPQARQVLGTVTRDVPRDISAWYLTSQLEARAGNGTAAEQAARQIAAIDPHDARGPLALAAAKAAQKDYKAVVAALEARFQAPTADDVQSGTYAEITGELYGAYSELHDRKHGVAVLEAAARRVPDNVQLQYMLGSAYDQNHEYDRAEAVFRTLIGAHPTFAQGLNYLGYMLAERGRKLPEAVDLITRALQIEKDNPAYLDSLGWAYFRMGAFEKARDPLERAAAALPKASLIQEHLGDVYLQLKRYDQAAGAFDRALAGDRDEIDPQAVAKKRDQARRDGR